MCTLTYLPRPEGGFTLTSSRDENPLRAAAWLPQKYVSPMGVLALYPKDPVAHGTWLLTTDNGITLCLLNGGLVKHVRQPAYRHSRGLVPLHFIEYSSPEDFLAKYAFDGLEPFSLIVLEEFAERRLLKLVWDGTMATLATLPANNPHIWSSATLYNADTQRWRTSLFSTWLSQTESLHQPEAILAFHQTAGQEDPANAIRMRRPLVETLSITTLHRTTHTCEMIYRDLVHHKQEQLCLIC